MLFLGFPWCLSHDLRNFILSQIKKNTYRENLGLNQRYIFDLQFYIIFLCVNFPILKLTKYIKLYF